MGLGMARGRISRFPFDLRRRPYNTLALPCECVMAQQVRSHAGMSILWMLTFKFDPRSSLNVQISPK